MEAMASMKEITPLAKMQKKPSVKSGTKDQAVCKLPKVQERINSLSKVKTRKKSLFGAGLTKKHQLLINLILIHIASCLTSRGDSMWR